jgi:hypothetical protein
MGYLGHRPCFHHRHGDAFRAHAILDGEWLTSALIAVLGFLVWSVGLGILFLLYGHAAKTGHTDIPAGTIKGPPGKILGDP